MTKRITWTEEDLRLLRELYPTTPNGDIADRLGLSSATISNKAHELGLKKAETFHNMNFYGRYTNKRRTR